MINLTAPINQLGYGIVGLNVLKALEEYGVAPAYLPIFRGIKIEPPKEDMALVQRCLDRPYYRYGHSVRIWHQNDLAHHAGTGLRCGFPIFELDRFTKEEQHHLCSQDVLFVTSDWAWNVLEYRDINTRIRVCPLGVDTKIFRPLDVEKNPFTTFINLGKWEVRKGHDVLVEAFNKAFEPRDRVRLWMVPSNPFLNDQQRLAWEGMYLDSPMGKAGKIQVFQRQATQHDVARLMNEADCGVFPSRAEGWNLEALEMMACGKQIIITDCTAHTEFCTHDNSLLIHIEDYEEAYDGIWFHGQGKWAHIGGHQMAQLVQHMKAVHACKQDMREFPVSETGIETAKRFTWQQTIEPIVEECLPF